MNCKEIFETMLSEQYDRSLYCNNGSLAAILAERADKRRRLSLHRRVLIIVMIVLVAVMTLGGFFVYNVIFYSDSTSDPDFVNFSAAAVSGAPEKIEHYYSISFPEGYYPDSTQRIFCTDTLYLVSYTDGNDGHISFAQHAINSFSIGYEKGTFEIINNYEDKTIDLYILGGNLISRLWTDGSYIYEVTARRELFELIDMKRLHEIYPEVHDFVYYWG